MCGSMVDIQSATAEIKRGKEDRRKKKDKTTGQKYNAPYYIGGALSLQRGHYIVVIRECGLTIIELELELELEHRAAINTMADRKRSKHHKACDKRMNDVMIPTHSRSTVEYLALNSSTKLIRPYMKYAIVVSRHGVIDIMI